MISLSMASLLGTNVGQDPGDDQLQADVMRFMAIIGFCLVAIFAVVQSLPLTRTTPAENHTSPAPSRAEQRQIAEQLAQARSRLLSMQAVQQELVAEIAQLRHRAQQLAQANARSQQQLVTDQRQLARVQKQLNQAATEAAKTGNTAAVATPSPVEPEKPVAKRARSADPDPVSVGAAQPVQAEAPGFVLTVASDPVLLQLLQQQRLALYVMSAGRTWHIAPLGASFRVADAQSPGQYHEMQRATVPATLRTLVSQQLTRHSPQSLIWGLVLPADMQRQLQQLMASRRQGQLIIGERGKIRHQPLPEHQKE